MQFPVHWMIYLQGDRVKHRKWAGRVVVQLLYMLCYLPWDVKVVVNDINGNLTIWNLK